MSISKREKNILILTVVVIVGALFYQFGLNSLMTAFSESAGDLESKQKVFESNTELLKQRKSIEQTYLNIERLFPKDSPEKTAKQLFSEDVEILFRELGIANGQIRTPKDEFIEGVDNYKEITIDIEADGKLDQIVSILKKFYVDSFIVKQLKISGDPDNEFKKLNISVSRVVKITPENQPKSKETTNTINSKKAKMTFSSKDDDKTNK